MGGTAVAAGMEGSGVFSCTGMLVGLGGGLRVGFFVGVIVGVFNDANITRGDGVGLSIRSNGTKRPCPAEIWWSSSKQFAVLSAA